ncbi:MAG: alanine:cation symporter family protein [Neisseriaceae bacterium]|nr:alanine:cation symporter family protein [Neisseriaceae bacterium]
MPFDLMQVAVDWLDDRLSYVLIALLLFVGFFFTFRLGFMQFRHFGHTITVLKGSRQADNSGISSYQAFCTSMASRVGTGNIAGIAVAVTLGGPGAVFWMWVIAVVGMSTAFVESTLAQLFKVKDGAGQYRGGPAYYMEKGLNARWMGVMFSLFLILAYGFVFNAVQANTIGESLGAAFQIPTWVTGIIIMVLTALIIFGGLRKIARFSEAAVPLMAGVYLLAALIIVVANYERLPAVFGLIYRSAFGLQEFAVGGFAAAIMQGVKRGLFSNEAGMGSAPNVAASATPYPPHPASQGYVQMFGVFVDTVIICTASAAIVLLSGVPLDSDATGIRLVQMALETEFGGWAKYLLAIIILFFAFTTIVTNYYYAESCMVFLRKKKQSRLLLFRCCVAAMVFFGAVASVPLVWSMANVSMTLMAVTNLVAILLLSPLAVRLAKDYNQQRQAGKLPTFKATDHPDIRRKLQDDIWD